MIISEIIFSISANLGTNRKPRLPGRGLRVRSSTHANHRTGGVCMQDAKVIDPLVLEALAEIQQCLERSVVLGRIDIYTLQLGF
jgi:hypothetical protein